MENELISVIVPVYNSEKYLEACINSIIGQTYQNLEIILVDDGSTDSSGKLCDAYAQKDDRIRVIHKKNQGLQAARNDGITMAQGEWIGFIDSDDWIDEEMYGDLYKSRGDSDLVTSGLWIYGKDGDPNKITDFLDPGIYDGHSEYFCNNLIIFSGKIRSGMFGGILNNAVCKLYKATIVKKCYPSINVGISNGEDLLFTIVYALLCKEIVVTHKCHYHYRYNASSICRSKNDNYLEEMNRLYKVLDRVITGHAMENSLRDQLNRLLMYDIHTFTSDKMQLGEEFCYPRYRFPLNNLLSGKNIVLFGAGKIGKSYYNDWRYNHKIHVVCWVDNAFPDSEVLGYKLYKPGEADWKNCDYVVCAVLNKEKAEEMKKQLIGYGVKENSILWEKPEDIFFKYYLRG